MFAALGFGGEARVSLARHVGAVSIGVAARAGGLLPYGRSAGLRQHDAALGLSLGIGR